MPSASFANPGISTKDLELARFIDRSGMTRYTVVGGDSFHAIAQKIGTTAGAIQALNPEIIATSLQIGQTINVPSGSSHTSPQSQKHTLGRGSTYQIQTGDTFYSIALRCGSTVAELELLNPGVSPTALQIGQTINVSNPVGSSATSANIHSTPQYISGGQSVGGGYVTYSGPTSNFPNPNHWASYDSLWAQNSNLMTGSDSASEIQLIGSAISSVASESGIDARAILCLIMQESGGNVRVTSTSSWQGVHNTGIMQAHNGVSFNSADPAGSIRQMIVDGTEGTASGDGLKQCLQHQGNYYAAFREYNSGAIGTNVKNLNDGGGATGDYVDKIANRLMGHVWAGM